MWVYIIIAFTIAMLVGPIMMLQPTQRQRRTAALREKAQGLGMSIAPSSLVTEEDRQCWYYYLPCAAKMELTPVSLERKSYPHGLHLAGIWSPAGPFDDSGREVLEALLRDLPDSVYGVDVKTQAAGVHWSERGGSDKEIKEGTEKSSEEQLQVLYKLLSGYVASAAVAVKSKEARPQEPNAELDSEHEPGTEAKPQPAED